MWREVGEALSCIRLGVNHQPGGYTTRMNREHWQQLAHTHRPSDLESRRCRDCAAYWPCWYRLRADTELADHR